jgi:hypothetical protein
MSSLLFPVELVGCDTSGHGDSGGNTSIVSSDPAGLHNNVTTNAFRPSKIF